ncbi:MULTISPECIES: hypothetical protein [unclassified Streptomyces]|uniref:hypothetical protein n=1 Tax=unclassified Streptomyces TaxID=2593676 RepID=UPI0009405740|nr:hypothetical protein [Streptomyces sp. TSRI0107]OKJ84141.1 hypothetical protein AMK31_18710 [Streptomyces sp. TSRI0107]
MSNQPYDGMYDGQYPGRYEGEYEGAPEGEYQGYGQYQQPQYQPQYPQAQYHPDQYPQYPQDPYQQAQPQYQGQYAAAPHTQQWEGRTWDTQAQPATAEYAPQQAYVPEQTYEPRTAVAEPAPAHAQAPAQASAPEPSAPLTAAQRARLEGRSPIIEPGLQPAALTALLGLLLSGAAAVGSWALLVPLVALQAVTAAGWFRLNGMWPARQGIALAFLGALTADAALLVAGRDNGPVAILGTLGVWVLLSLVLQLRSHADPDERLYGLMATVVSAALAVVAAGHLAAEPDAVTIGAAAVAVAILARALPLPTPVSVVVALLAAAGGGFAAGGLTGAGSGTDGALLGAAAGVCALIGHRVASYDYPSRFVHFTAGVALPLSAAAPVVWVLGRTLG